MTDDDSDSGAFRLSDSQRNDLRQDVDPDALEELLRRLPAGARMEVLKWFCSEPMIDRSETTADLMVDGEIKRVRVIAESDRLQNMTINDPTLDALLRSVFRQRVTRREGDPDSG